jgi:hypothetical protein
VCHGRTRHRQEDSLVANWRPFSRSRASALLVGALLAHPAKRQSQSCRAPNPLARIRC